MAIGQTNAAKPRQAVESAEALAMSIASAGHEDNRPDLYKPQSEKSPCQTARSTKDVTQFESLTLIARNSGKDTPVSREAINRVASKNDNTSSPMSTDFSDNRRNRRLASFTGDVSRHGRVQDERRRTAFMFQLLGGSCFARGL